MAESINNEDKVHHECAYVPHQIKKVNQPNPIESISDEDRPIGRVTTKFKKYNFNKKVFYIHNSDQDDADKIMNGEAL